MSLLTNASVALVPASSSPETHGRPSLEALGLELSDYKFHTHQSSLEGILACMHHLRPGIRIVLLDHM